MSQEVSHGRGGAGNIDKDDTLYVDGEVVRSGVEGSHQDGPFSTGRGGTGNIGDAKERASTERADETIVPVAATRPSAELTDYHTGRGGAGNEHLAIEKADETPVAPAAPAAAEETTAAKAAVTVANGTNVGLADKLKNKLFGAFKK